MKKTLSTLAIILAILLVGALILGALAQFNQKEQDVTPSTDGSTTEHTHIYSDEWSSNEDYHWQVATCDHDVTRNKAMHDFDEGVETSTVSSTQHGEITYTCQTCNYAKTEVLHNYEFKSEQLNPGSDKLVEYSCSICEDMYYLSEHSFVDEWSFDENYHWHNSTCEHSVTSVKEAHNFQNDVCSLCYYSNKEYSNLTLKLKFDDPEDSLDFSDLSSTFFTQTNKVFGGNGESPFTIWCPFISYDEITKEANAIFCIVLEDDVSLWGFLRVFNYDAEKLLEIRQSNKIFFDCIALYEFEMFFLVEDVEDELLCLKFSDAYLIPIMASIAFDFEFVDDIEESIVYCPIPTIRINDDCFNALGTVRPTEKMWVFLFGEAQ